ncbi:MAG: hypothetical protein IT335_05070 [Thermomicrobiales bacterium]|nr:hypothetical protein [Thermomicrobiales bacterium]
MNIRDRSTVARLLFALVLAATLLFGSLLGGIAVAQDGTPEATPAVTFSPEEARFARLGGTLADVLAEYGTPDWTDDGLVGYNSRILGGIDTITMVFYDPAERVRSYMLIYLERPEELNDPARIAQVVADVAPRDGRCATEPDDDNLLGEEVYLCQSDGLKGVFSPDDLLSFDVVGDDGAYNYAIDPTEDAYFEIVVRMGSDGIPGPPTPVPTPTPPPPPPLTKTYPAVKDVAKLVDGSIEAGTPLSVTGTILDIRLSETGTILVMDIPGDDESVLVLAENQDDLTGVSIGETWTVYGIYTGFVCEDGCSATIQVVKLG